MSGISSLEILIPKPEAGEHNCNAHQSEGRVGIFKYNLQMQVIGALFASYLQTAGYDA